MRLKDAVTADDLSNTGGIWTIRIGAAALPVLSISDDDIIITEDQQLDPFPGLDATFNGVTAQYPEGLVDRMPVVRSVYSGIKQISETVFAQSERSFDKACMVQYPRCGIWAVGFVSTTAKGEISERAETGGELISVFVPTTPNPTSGFLLFFPKEDVIELDMTVEDAAKLVISAGLVYPNGKDPARASE